MVLKICVYFFAVTLGLTTTIGIRRPLHSRDQIKIRQQEYRAQAMLPAASCVGVGRFYALSFAF